MVVPSGKALSRKTASPPATRLRWLRGTARKPSAVTSKDIIAALRPSWVTARVVVDALGDRMVERGHAFGQVAAEAADMTNRKGLDRRVHGEVGVIDAVDLARGHDRPRAGAIERHRQFRLPPEQRHQRDDQARRDAPRAPSA